MPSAPPKPCKAPSCSVLTTDGYCVSHKAERRRADRWRGSAASRGYDHQWNLIREKALKRDTYLCAECQKQGRIRPANEVHHIIKIKNAPHLRLDINNLMSVCKDCHQELEKTA